MLESIQNGQQRRGIYGLDQVYPIYSHKSHNGFQHFSLKIYSRKAHINQPILSKQKDAATAPNKTDFPKIIPSTQKMLSKVLYNSNSEH